MSTSEQFALTGQGRTEPQTPTDSQSDTFGSPSSASCADTSSDTTQARDHPEYVVLGSDLISNEIKELPMLYEGLIPANCIWAIIGASDTCKSMLLRQLGCCIAGGQDFLGRGYLGKHQSVVIVCSEDDELSISVLLKMQNRTIGLTEDQLTKIRFIFDTSDLREKLDKELERKPVDLVIIDAFGDLFDGKEMNQNNQVRTFLNSFDSIAKKHSCSLCFLHHTGKRTEEGLPSKNNAIGSQGFEAKMRLVIELRKDPTNENLRHLCVVKGNYLPETVKGSSFVLQKDENCVFTDTGTRKSFEELAINKEGAAQTRNKTKTPYDIEEMTHKEFLIGAFKDLKTKLSGRRLTEKVCQRFGVSDQKARLFVDFYLDRKWILDKSTSTHRKELQLNPFTLPAIF